jgi:hypothetical protein
MQPLYSPQARFLSALAIGVLLPPKQGRQPGLSTPKTGVLSTPKTRALYISSGEWRAAGASPEMRGSPRPKLRAVGLASLSVVESKESHSVVYRAAGPPGGG